MEREGGGRHQDDGEEATAAGIGGSRRRIMIETQARS